MKKILMVALCLAIVPMLFAAESDANVVNETAGPTNAAPIQLQKSTSPCRVPQSRDLLFSQIPSNTANSVACQLDSVYPFEADLVEDVTPTEDWVIDSVVGYCRPWGAWVGWSLVPNVRFLVYADSSIGNHPVDSPFVEIIIDQGTYETTVYGSGYIVGLPLPYSVNLTAGVTYWLEVQPCFSFAANGQIGTMTEVGIGNGQEFFNRFPLLGTTVFTTAAAGGWTGQEGGIELYGTTGAAPTTFWDFEDGWQGWTHTSGQTFPAAWSVVTTTYPGGPYWTYQPPPDAGDSAFIIDSDAAGSGVTVCDTAMSPVVPNSGFEKLKWGMFLQNDNLQVLLREFTAGAWDSWNVVFAYSSTTGPQWDSVDVSAYTGDSIQVAFQYDDGGGWWYGATFDNVGLYVPADHDVASIQFLSPGLIIAPGTEDVIGVVANLGMADETYDVHCVVTDPSVVLDVTINVTTLVGESDTLNFGSVDFQDGTTYDIMMATLLVDDDPTNDTLTQSTYCTSVFWEILTNMPYTTSGPYAGWSYDPSKGTTYIHVFGGNPGPQNNHYIWDGSAWNTSTPLPQAANYGGHCSVDNKIYMIGSRVSGPDALITIYDADGDVYSTVTLPHAIGDPAVTVKDNNYIYIIGGCLTSGWDASTSVMLYDIAGDSFITTVTQLPGADARTCAAAGYIGNDTIVVAGGIDGGGSYTNTTLLGYVDPTNPANITWSHGPDKPGSAVYRLNGEAFLNTFYIAGGDPFTTEAYKYDSLGWSTLPDKPTANSNWGCAMAPVDVTDDAEGIMYALGGYSPYMSIAEALHTSNIDCIYEQPSDVPVAFTSRMISSNPVAGRAKIEFAMLHQGPVTFSIYDISGRRVHNSEYSSISAGTHTILWSCTDNAGRDVPAGIYFYHLEAAGNVATGKLIIVQ